MRNTPTTIRRSWDMARLRRAIAGPGVDIRHWVSYATVATVGGEDGAPNFEDENAILVTPAGVEVDVVLQPSNYPMTCRYGLACGSVFVCGPIRAGDQVIVVLADGDVSMIGQIVCVISGSSDPIPTGQDGLPLFQNDRFLVHAKGVPIDLRTDGGARVLVDADGTVVMNEGDRGVARIRDTAKLTLDSDDLATLGAALLATGLFTPSGVGPLPVPPPFPTFEGGEITSSSETVKAGD